MLINLSYTEIKGRSMTEKEEALEYFNKTIDFSHPSLGIWKETFLTHLNQHNAPMKMAEAFIRLCKFLESKPVCTEEIQIKKIFFIINASARHSAPDAFIAAIVHILQKPSITDDTIPNLSNAFKNHPDPLALAQAILYFFNTPLLKKNNPKMSINFEKIQQFAGVWFTLPLLDIFTQISKELITQEIFDQICDLSALSVKNKNYQVYKIACHLWSTHYKNMQKELNPGVFFLFDFFVKEKSKQFTALASVILNFPKILYEAQHPENIICLLMHITPANIFNDPHNLNTFLLMASFWFDHDQDNELTKRFTTIPQTKWTVDFLETLNAMSKSINASHDLCDATKDLWLQLALYEHDISIETPLQSSKYTRPIHKESSTAKIFDLLKATTPKNHRDFTKKIEHSIQYNQRQRLRSRTENEEILSNISKSTRTHSCDTYEPPHKINPLC